VIFKMISLTGLSGTRKGGKLQLEEVKK